jgi:hypothetical protein
MRSIVLQSEYVQSMWGPGLPGLISLTESKLSYKVFFSWLGKGGLKNAGCKRHRWYLYGSCFPG